MMSLKKIINMVRLWFLIWYFTRSDRPQGNNPSWINDVARQDEFVFAYLIHKKHFLEDWRGTLWRWYYLKIVGGWPTTTNPTRLARTQKRYKLINDLISKAIERNYLLISQTSPETLLTIGWKGREFIRFLPFLNALAKEYTDFTSTLSIILGSVGGTLLIVFWQKIIEWFASMI